MVIDIHAHCGRLLHHLPYLNIEQLIEILDRMGIDRACLMAVENPEEVDYFFTTEQVLAAWERYPDRIIPFCNVDPRHRYPESFDPLPVIREYAQRGCRGVGEMLAGVPIDHPGLQKIYAACAEVGLPVLFHSDHLICSDDPQEPRLERMLQTYPETIFIGHSTRFWAEISQNADLDPVRLANYPSGPVTPTGATDRLLGQYPNLYGDLSAGSGYTAVTRDLAFGLDFMERHQDKLLYGTDVLKPDQDLPLLPYLRACSISETARQKILHGNAERLLKIS